MRFYYDDADPERRDRVARAATGVVLGATTVVALVAAAFAGPLSQLVLGFRDTTLMLITVLGPTPCCGSTSARERSCAPRWSTWR